ncbi:hypothetical protein [Rhodospira trueperi]|uniref:DUF2568 domain-containing protein n=1 Tax=Rhodospira trueperi TaxID=69960 RepID=A0A1G6ZY44_9PROT|nr:hypothetical protein [Rhodospira trueperi]SDE07303.1 hypothetical protein SAMN05421720_10386 [Rhodospira trueperi]
METLRWLHESGLVADLIVAVIVLEAVGLAWLHRRLGRDGWPWHMVLALIPGAALVMALGAALRGADWTWVGAWLLVSLVFHLTDLWVRWRR